MALTAGRHLRRWALALLAASLAALTVRRTLIEIAGPSMEPTLQAGDRLVTIPARPSWLRQGQIVVLIDPKDVGHSIIKRISRLDGATAEVTGDNPWQSTDSRIWGPVPVRSIRRIAVTRWPDVLHPPARIANRRN